MNRTRPPITFLAMSRKGTTGGARQQSVDFDGALILALDRTALQAVRLDMPTSAPPDAPPHVRELVADLADARPMRRGSLSERTIKCSKPGCACAQDPKARHGPYFSLTHAVGGKTHSRFLNAEQAELARQQIDAGRDFRGRVDALWEACETWADTQLKELAASSEEAKKRGSPGISKTKSSRKSKGS